MTTIIKNKSRLKAIVGNSKNISNSKKINSSLFPKIPNIIQFAKKQKLKEETMSRLPKSIEEHIKSFLMGEFFIPSEEELKKLKFFFSYNKRDDKKRPVSLFLKTRYSKFYYHIASKELRSEKISPEILEVFLEDVAIKEKDISKVYQGIDSLF